jgi:peptide chain release factor subunit 1
MTELQRLLKLRQLRGSGTSIVSLIIPAKTQICAINAHITKELSTASNVKDKCNRKSIIDALKSTNALFKNIKNIPSNGIATFAGSYF